MEEVKVVVPPKKKLIGKIITYIFGGLIVLLLGFQILGSVTAQSNYGVPSFFGYQTLIVLTDSMEPAIKVDEAIIIKKTDPSKIKASTSIEAYDGDVITFFRRQDGLIVTHRVIEVLPQENGQYHFKTLGDNLNAETCLANGSPCDPLIHYDYVYDTDVLGVVVGKSKTFGNIVNFATNPFVIAGVAIVPLFYVFISSIADIVKHSKMGVEEFEDNDAHNVEMSEFEVFKQQEKMKLLIEIEKEKLKAELAADLEKTNKENEDENHE